MARQLVIELVGEASKFVKSLDDAQEKSKTFGDKVGDAGKKLTAFASVPIIGFLGASTKAAMDDAAAQAHLAEVLAHTAGNSQALVAQVEGYITAAQKVSTFTDDELRPAFENLVTVTHNAKDANGLLTTAMDLAAAKNIDLATASQVVAKAHEGNFAAVNKLVPGLIDVRDKSLTAEQAMGQLATTFGGSAAAATETTAGKMQNLKRDLGEAGEAMGTKLLPVLTGFAGFVTDKLLPAIDSLSGGNGAFLLMAAALAGPVLSAVSKVKDAVILLNGALTFLAEHPVILFLATLALTIKQMRDDWNSFTHDVETGTASWKKTFGYATNVSGIGLLDTLTGGHLKGLIPGFATGGVVGGPLGQAQLAVVHGGERITPWQAGGAGGGGGNISIFVAGSVVTDRQLVDAVHEGLLKKQRTTPLGLNS
jgi:hypothetical protein